MLLVGQEKSAKKGHALPDAKTMQVAPAVKSVKRSVALTLFVAIKKPVQVGRSVTRDDAKPVVMMPHATLEKFAKRAAVLRAAKMTKDALAIRPNVTSKTIDASRVLEQVTAKMERSVGPMHVKLAWPTKSVQRVNCASTSNVPKAIAAKPAIATTVRLV